MNDLNVIVEYEKEKGFNFHEKYGNYFYDGQLSYGVHCGTGWFPIVNEFLENFSKIDDIMYSDNKIYHIGKVDGQLKIYVNGNKKVSEISDLVARYEFKSMFICEKCGKHGNRKNDEVVCERCGD